MLGWNFQLSGSISDGSNKDSGVFGVHFLSIMKPQGLGNCSSRTFIKRERRGPQDRIVAYPCIPAHLTTPRTVQEEVASMKMKKHLVDKAAFH